MKDPVRVATGRIGALKLHGTYDSRQLTANARSAFLARFRDQAAAAAAARGEQISDEELDRRAASLRQHHFALMAYKREKARKKKAAGAATRSGQTSEASRNATDAA